MLPKTRRRRIAVILLVILACTAVVIARLTAPAAERHLATEQADIAAIGAGILTIQARYAAEQHRPLGRGTHTKGICAAADFEVLDLTTGGHDPALVARLARGIYAQPATYPAAVRFANGQSYIYPDSTPDVRALSFSLELPPEAASDQPARRDFTMNNAPIFPLNDAHAFAVALQVATAPSAARGIRSLSFRDTFGFARTAVLGRQEQRPATVAYQQTRYWSTVPFQHGADEVIKYSAVPCPGNPARALGTGPDKLQDELVRHLTDDETMSCFDFRLQLLDVDRMTYWGRRRTAAFWTENASVEWNERQAPFHTVGRLTLRRGSQLTPAACDAMYIDVTEHSAEGSRPLGSINRARWAGESASRRARLGH